MDPTRQIHEKLFSLDFSLVDFHEFTPWLYETYNEQSVFEPLRQPIEPRHFFEFVKYFPNFEELEKLVNQEFCEYYRVKILQANGFTTEDGYCYSPNNIKSVYKYWTH